MAEARGLYCLARDTLRVRGAERKTWLDGLLTCAVTGVGAGVGAYGLLLTKQGKIVTDVFLLDSGTELWVGVATGRGSAVRELLERYLVMEDAELEQAPEPCSWLVVATQGSGAEQAGAVARGALVLSTLQVELVLSSQAPSAQLPDLGDLWAEHGLGVFGVDFDERDNPHEASLDRIAVSWTKGCYLGQEVVCMQDMRGKVKRRLVALDGSAALGAAAAAKEVLAADGSVVGQVSSVHPAPGGTPAAARFLASISSSALESPAELRILGERVRVAFGAPTNLS